MQVELGFFIFFLSISTIESYIPFYKRNYFHFNVLSDKISTTTTPLPTTKLNDPGNVSTLIKKFSLFDPKLQMILKIFFYKLRKLNDYSWLALEI